MNINELHSKKWLHILIFIVSGLFLSHSFPVAVIHEFGHIFFTAITGGHGEWRTTRYCSLTHYSDFSHFVGTMGGVWMVTALFMGLWRFRRKRLLGTFAMAITFFHPFDWLLFSHVVTPYGLTPDWERVDHFYLAVILWMTFWFWIYFRKPVKQYLAHNKTHAAKYQRRRSEHAVW